MILEAPLLKEGSGKELRCLHDSVQQHLRALKAMECELPGSFITSILKLKLDQDTMFEWQKCSHESTTVPHYSKLLDFINLCAQASESLPSSKKPNPPNKLIASLHPTHPIHRLTVSSAKRIDIHFTRAHDSNLYPMIRKST